MALVNVGVFALGVYPMTARRSALERRANQARTARVTAQKDLASAKAMVSSEGRAQGELKTFYQDVLPTSLAPDVAGLFTGLIVLHHAAWIAFLAYMARSSQNSRRREF